MNYSCLYLAEIQSLQNRCKFATICDRKGYAREKCGSDLHVHVHVGRHHLDTAGRMERLTSALKSVLDKKHDLQTVVSA